MNTVETPTAADLGFADALPSWLRPSSRPALVPMLERAGLYRLTETAHPEDVRDALDRVKAETVLAQLDATDRATLYLTVRAVLKDAKVPHSTGLIRSALDTPDPQAAAAGGSAVLLREDEPCDGPVDVGALLDETAAIIRARVVLTPAAAATCALWIGAAYAIEALSLMPMLLISSAVMRSGKSTLGVLLGALLPRVVSVSSLTAAVVFRLIESHHPTLIADEADAWLSDETSELRGIFNAGHSRATAHVARCVGDDHDVRLYSTFCARVLLMIGRPPATIADRSITITLRRKHAGERVERMRLDRLADAMCPLRRRWRRWAVDDLDAMRMADATVPETLHDRAADNWRPLLAVADLAAGDWSTRARHAAVELSGDSEPEDGIGVKLLADVRTIFSDHGDPEHLSSDDLVGALNRMVEQPWPGWNKGRGISVAQLAKHVRGFGEARGLSTRHTRLDPTRTAKRWHRADFLDPWIRYLEPKHPKQTNEYGPEPAFSDPKQNLDVSASKIEVSPMFTESVSGVSGSTPENQGSREIEGVTEAPVPAPGPVYTPPPYCPGCSGPDCAWCDGPDRDVPAEYAVRQPEPGGDTEEGRRDACLPCWTWASRG